MKRIPLLLVTILFLTSCSSKFPYTKYEQAYEKLIEGKYETAAYRFQTLTSRYSKYPEIWYNAGCCYMEIGKYESAIYAFKKASEVYENSVMYDDKEGLRNDAMTSIGEVYLLQKSFSKAKNQFEKCFELQNDKNMVTAVAATYIRLGYTEECKKYYSEKGIDIGVLGL